jgi:hypothetical protein
MTIKNKSRLLLFFIVLLASCGSGNYKNDAIVYGNPDGYRIYLLTGDSLDTRSVAVNGLSVDTSTVASIHSSVQDIIASSCKPNVINTIPEKAADYVIDYTKPVKTVPDTYYGLNMQIESKQFLTMSKYRELIKNIHVDIIRFPGGQERIKYDKKASPDAVWKLGNDKNYQYVLTGKDVENYIKFCKELGIRAEPEVNIYNNDPVMAKNLISQIVNDLGYDLKYISTGNEPDVNVISNWTYLEAGNKNEAMDHYMTRYKTYYDGIKSVKPDADFVLCELGMWQRNELANNLGRMLGQMESKLPGAISAHWYMLGDWGQPLYFSDFPSFNHVVISDNNDNTIRYLSDIMKTMKELRDQNSPKAKLFIGEWGVAWSATDASQKLHDKLFTVIFNAEVMEYCKTLGFDSMQFFSISDPGYFSPWWNPALISVDGDIFTLRPQYYLYLFYKYVWGNKIVSIPDNQNDNYSIYASMDNKYRYIMLINRTPGTDYTKSVKIITEKGAKYLELKLYAKSVTVIRF